jgi:hypothetical protein
MSAETRGAELPARKAQRTYIGHACELEYSMAAANLLSMIEVKQSAGDEWVVSVKSTVTTHHRVRVTKKMSNAWLRAGPSKYCSGEQFWNGPVVSRERAG